MVITILSLLLVGVFWFVSRAAWEAIKSDSFAERNPQLKQHALYHFLRRWYLLSQRLVEIPVPWGRRSKLAASVDDGRPFASPHIDVRTNRVVEIRPFPMAMSLWWRVRAYGRYFFSMLWPFLLFVLVLEVLDTSFSIRISAEDSPWVRYVAVGVICVYFLAWVFPRLIDMMLHLDGGLLGKFTLAFDRDLLVIEGGALRKPLKIRVTEAARARLFRSETYKTCAINIDYRGKRHNVFHTTLDALAIEGAFDPQGAIERINFELSQAREANKPLNPTPAPLRGPAAS